MALHSELFSLHRQEGKKRWLLLITGPRKDCAAHATVAAYTDPPSWLWLCVCLVVVVVDGMVLLFHVVLAGILTPPLLSTTPTTPTLPPPTHPLLALIGGV